MTLLEVGFDAQTLTEDTFRRVVAGGILLKACGLVNRRWDDYSAQECATALGVENVTWEIVHDDTPGVFSCLLFYPHLTQQEVLRRLEDGTITEYGFL